MWTQLYIYSLKSNKLKVNKNRKHWILQSKKKKKKDCQFVDCENGSRGSC